MEGRCELGADFDNGGNILRRLFVKVKGGWEVMTATKELILSTEKGRKKINKYLSLGC